MNISAGSLGKKKLRSAVGQRLVSGQPHLESGVGPWNEVCQREAGNLTQIAKMAERTERAFPDCILLPVTAAIYHNGEQKPAMHWPFEMGVGGKVIRSYSILLPVLEKDLVSVIDAVS